jgi:hypothetical protein
VLYANDNGDGKLITISLGFVHEKLEVLAAGVPTVFLC